MLSTRGPNAGQLVRGVPPPVGVSASAGQVCGSAGERPIPLASGASGALSLARAESPLATGVPPLVRRVALLARGCSLWPAGWSALLLLRNRFLRPGVAPRPPSNVQNAVAGAVSG